MHFICSGTDLVEGLSIVSHALSAKTTMPILEGIYIEVSEDTISLMATDTLFTIQTKIPAKVLEEGIAVLPGRLLHDIVRRLPEGELVCQTDGSQVVLQCMGSRTVLQSMPPEEYPPMGDVDGPTLHMPQDMLRDLVRGCVFAVAVDETRPILTGCLVEMEGGDMRMVALDGFRFALRNIHVEDAADIERASMVVPGKALNDLSRILKDEGDVGITIAENRALFDLGATRVVTRLLEGEFIKYAQIIPQGQGIHCKVSRDELEQCLERASLMARAGKNNLVRLQITDEQMVITSNSETGNIRESLEIQLHGEELTIAFNVRFLTDIIKAIDTEYITMHFDSNVSPCVIKPVSGEAFVYLLLPVRVSA